MTNSLVHDLASSLKPDEVESFRIFLQSEFFNRDFNVVELTTLFEVMQKALVSGDLETLQKDTLYGLVFPDRPWIRNKLEKLASDLNKMLRMFLLTQRYLNPENELNQQLDWLKELRAKGLATRHQHVLDKAKKEIEIKNIESLEQYYYRQQLAQEEYEWRSLYNTKGDMKLPELIGHVDDYYYVYRTELMNRLLLQHRHSNLEAHVIAMIQKPWIVPEAQLNNSVILRITWSIHLLLKDENPSIEAFQDLLSYLKSQESILIPWEIKAFYTYLRSLCSIFIDHGHDAFFFVLHELQKDNLDRGYFYFEDKIFPHSCLSITQIAIVVGAIEWGKQFVEAHKNRIFGDGEEREYYKLNLAICYFAEKEYDAALETMLLHTPFSTYHLMARRLELKCYFELRSDLLPYKIDAFSMFIRRAGQRVYSKDTEELNLNFVNALRQIHLSTDISDPTRSQRLTKRINAKKMIAERKWLLEKAAELGRNTKKTPR